MQQTKRYETPFLMLLRSLDPINTVTITPLNVKAPIFTLSVETYLKLPSYLIRVMKLIKQDSVAVDSYIDDTEVVDHKGTATYNVRYKDGTTRVVFTLEFYTRDYSKGLKGFENLTGGHPSKITYVDLGITNTFRLNTTAMRPWSLNEVRGSTPHHNPRPTMTPQPISSWSPHNIGVKPIMFITNIFEKVRP